MCISCCTNIVQCRAWNKKKGWRQAGSSFHEPTDCRQLLHQHRTDQFIPQTQACVPLRRRKKKKKKRRNASLLFKTVKEIWVKTQLRIEKKESKPFYGDFPLPPPLPCGDFWQRTNRQSILSLQLLSIFRDKQKSAGEELELVLPCSETAGELGLSSAPSFFFFFFTPLTEISLFFTEVWTCRRGGGKKGISLNTVEVTKALAKENALRKQKGGVNGALVEMVKAHQCLH